MEKRSRRRVPELVTRLAFQGLSENEIGRARISMMARNANVPFKGRIQKRKTYHLQIITFGLQRAAGPYSWVIGDRGGRSQTSIHVRFAPKPDKERIRYVRSMVRACDAGCYFRALLKYRRSGGGWSFLAGIR